MPPTDEELNMHRSSFVLLRRLASLSALLLCLLAGGASQAQIQIDKRRPAPAQGEICVSSHFGSIRIHGWERNEVAVQGTMAAGAEGLDFDVDEDGVSIDVEIPEAWLYLTENDAEYRTELTVSVPVGYSACANTLNATVQILDVRGEVDVETVNGSVEVRGPIRLAQVETVTGNVTIEAQGAPMDVETLTGNVTLTGVREEAEIETVSGEVRIRGEQLESVEIATNSGPISIDGSFVRGDGEIEVESFSGPVQLVVPPDIAAEFEIRTFGGTIRNAIGPSPRRESQFSPYKMLRFSTLLDDDSDEEFSVEIETHDGDIDLQTRGGKP